MLKTGFIYPSVTTALKKRMRRAVYSGPPGQDPSEIFDVYAAPPETHNGFVTAPNTPLGQKKRHLVHRDGDWHRSVHIWLTHPPSLSVLLQKRSPYKDTNPNKWDVSSAGHITHGDDSQVTASKEVEEELAVAQYTHPAIQCNEFQDVYLVELEGDRESYKFDDLGESEVSAVKFLSLGEVERALNSEDQNYVVRPEAYRKRFFELLRSRYGQF